MQGFETLTAEELSIIMNAIPYTAILIGGADGDFDSSEKAKAEKIAHIRSYSGSEDLREFWDVVDLNLHTKIEELLERLPNDVAVRQDVVSDELSKLNNVLPKLDKTLARHYYDSLRSYSRHIAKSSGGFLGMLGIGPKENKYVKLKMVTPIV